MSWLRAKGRTVRAALRFLAGWIAYAWHGHTPPMAYQSLVHLFCVTAGRFNDGISALIRLVSRRKAVGPADGVLGRFSPKQLNDVVDRLRTKGYVVFPGAMTPDQCDRLMRFAMATPATVRRMDGDSERRVDASILFDPAHPLAVRYDYSASDLLNEREVQELLADGSLIALAQAYLGVVPKADILSMWWHTNFHSQPDSEAAQFYHFDMDRIKWLKIFVYLTDVGPRDGAHAFIEGSHRTGGIPDEFLSRGYVRLSDEEVLAHYGPAREVVFSAPRGTIIVEDTRGLHKGRPVEPDGASRLVLQLQFSNSLFGAQTPVARMTKVQSPAMARLLRDVPEIHRQYV